MIYVPDTSYRCYVVQSDTTIRAYSQVPQNNRTISYRDYYFTANYLFRDGTQTFGSTTTLPVCLDSSLITDKYYYRNDFSSILVIFMIMSIFIFYLPFKIISRFFGRWLKL